MSVSDLAKPRTPDRYPLGAWALALTFFGPFAVTLLTGVITGLLLPSFSGWNAFGWLGVTAMLMPALLTAVQLTAIGLAIAGLVRGDDSGRSAARVALVVAGIWLVGIGVFWMFVAGVDLWP